MFLAKLSVALLAILAMQSPLAIAQRVAYAVASAPDARVELIVEKTGLMSGKKHLFLFPEFTADLQFDAQKPENSTIGLRLDAARIECKDDWVSEKDLKKIEAEARDKMLQVAKHKEIVFRSTAIRAQGGGKYLVEGMLTIRGMEKPARVEVTMQPGATGQAEAGGALAFSGEASVDMTDWGLKPPSAVLGAVGTNKVMQLRFQLTARR
ncbi:MAG: YceI family protein [Bryobacterales bacterium]|nr:YceI family protein [Bryobacterales bacterium]